MNGITKRQLVLMVAVRISVVFLMLTGILLLSAGTADYWQAWLYLGTLFSAMLFILIFLFTTDPGLLERRMKTRETQTEQKFVVKSGTILYLLIFLIPGFDRRFGWSELTSITVIIADLFVLTGYGIFALVLRANSYASRVIEVEKDQTVITDGPYAVVRHPMYSGIIVMFMATPLALGSAWAVIPALLLLPLFVIRIRNEEKVLSEELAGYGEYKRRTRFRLFPGIW